MNKKIPNSVIGTVALVLSQYYYSHSKLNNLFWQSGAPGDPPNGNCEEKCRLWLKYCNEDDATNPLEVLGKLIQPLMDLEHSPFHQDVSQYQESIKCSLTKNNLAYQINGIITFIGSSPATSTLTDYFKSNDLSSIESELKRTLENLESDPHAAITAASSIIEALCKTYIEIHNLEMPTSQTITSLWKVMQQHLGLNPNQTLQNDQKQVLQGLTSIIHGIGALRTHIGSAHGRGKNPPKIKNSEARLAVNAAHTIVVFVMECWKKPN